jgi:uncharacterized protein YsxB (DUF464 family)
MFNEVLELLKTPVTAMRKKAEERNVKKELITAAIIAVVLAVVTVITSYISVIKTVNKKYPSLEKYNKNLYTEVTKEKFKEMKKEAKEEAFENVELVKTFFKTLAISAVSIALVAGILFVISRMVKSPKDYIELIAMTNGAYIIYLLGFLLNVIFSYIYAQIGIILLVGMFIYALISLCNAFRDSIEIENSDKLSMFSAIVLTVVFAILVIIAMNYINSLISPLGDLSSLL